MKKALLFLAGILILASCVKQDPNQEPSNKWNGYFKYFKNGPVTRLLLAAQHDTVGTVEYGLNSEAELYVTYTTTGSYWMSETHMLASGCLTCYTNKPGNPKVGRFPYSGTHPNGTQTVTYTVSLVDLPPAEDPGFVIAAHCIVNGPGYCETGWAECEVKFADKEWGWYDIISFYDLEDHPVEVIYGTEFVDNIFKLYIIDVTNGVTKEIYNYDVGSGTFDATAYDPETNNFYFTDVTTGTLWVTSLTTNADPEIVDVLVGTTTSGTFLNDSYYYVEQSSNVIYRVDFNSDNSITITSIGSVEGVTQVNDIAIDALGENIYILGVNTTGTADLIKYDIDNPSASVTYPTTLNEFAQIAFGPDQTLYAVQPTADGTMAYTVDITSGMITAVKDGTIDDGENPVDPRFSDISGGRTF